MTSLRSPLRLRSIFIGAAFVFATQPLLAVAVTGTVRDTTSSPLANMVVEAYTTAGTLQAAGTTDALGRYGLDLPPGNYRVLAYDNGGVFATAFAGNADSYESTPILKLQSTPAQIDFTLVRGGVIGGAVTVGGAPIREVTVAAYNSVSRTLRGSQKVDANGRYSLVLPPGSYKLIAYHLSGLYAPQFYSGRNTFDEADPVTVVVSMTQPVNFALVSAASVLGVVRDTAGRPLPDITILAYNAAGTTQTGETRTTSNGQFSISLAPGTYRLVAADYSGVYAAAFLGGASSFLASDALALVAGEFRSGIVLTMVRGSRVSGTIVDRETGIPLPNVTVGIFNLDGTLRTDTQTNAQGLYSVTIPPGSYKIAAYDMAGAYALQFFSQQVTFEGSTIFAASESAGFTADFQLGKAARISGRVLDRGLGAAGVVVAAYTIDGVAVASATTDSTGRYSISLPPGTYRFIAYDPEFRFAPGYEGGATSFPATPVHVLNSGAAESLDFTVTRGVRVSGTIKDPRGALVGGVEISALSPDGRRLAVTTSAPDGRYVLVVLPGTYVIAASDPVRRYSTCYHRNATSQRTATPVVVSENAQPTVDFMLQPVSRHRAASR